ncbi:hypothetical protein MP228_009760 [Amoeboaphelidium protococcarum]|nr:hypothetical protein MP228_009760 [Amoeboaphelidium protococcarum]
MKNIVYLIKSTRHLKPQSPITYVGQTNYLYRQLLINNHDWNPALKERKRNPCVYTIRKLFYKPIAVVTGFPSENLASQFQQLFNNQYSELGVTFKDVKNNPFLIDPVEYRTRQLVSVCRDFYKSTSSADLTQSQLTIHWDTALCKPDLLYQFPPDVLHVEGIDVSAIDQMCYDENDQDDDRNWRKFRDLELAQIKQEKMERLSKELRIPVDKVDSILHDSRVAAKKNLLSKNQKVAKKAVKYVHLIKKVQPHQIASNNNDAALKQLDS